MRKAFAASSALLGLLGTILSGCATPIDISRQAIGYEEELADALNQDLLLNIVRASRSHPLLFVDFSQVSSFSSASAEIDISLPLGADAADILNLLPSLSRTHLPRFGVSPRDDAAFTKGILAPLPVETLHDLLQRNQSRLLLWSLFIERIEEKGQVYYNDPSDRARFYEFQIKLQDLVANQNLTTKLTDPTNVGPPLAAGSINVNHVTEARRNGLSLVRVKEDPPMFQLQEKGELVIVRDGPGPRVEDEKAPRTAQEDDLVLRRRSVEGMVSYLGAILLAQTRSASPYVPTIPDPDRKGSCGPGPAGGAGSDGRCWAPIFQVDRGSRAPALVAVTYKGARYAVPDSEEGGGYTVQAFSLASQLLKQFSSQNQTADDSGIIVFAR